MSSSFGISFLEGNFHDTEENRKILKYTTHRRIMEADNYQQIQQILGLEDDLLARISSSYVD
ncbi:hypothetical protein [uncultured Nostoc sp.]|uniref:hypothetical protein n=1 Tax=uncultured Nostoc sp. TaxID=340711 RepID=UPI0035C9E9A3